MYNDVVYDIGLLSTKRSGVCYIVVATVPLYLTHRSGCGCREEINGGSINSPAYGLKDVVLSPDSTPLRGKRVW